MRLRHFLHDKEFLLSMSGWKWALLFLLTATIVGGAVWAILEMMGRRSTAGPAASAGRGLRSSAVQVGTLGAGGMLGVSLLPPILWSIFRHQYSPDVAGEPASSTSLWGLVAVAVVGVNVLGGALFAVFAARKLRD
jgi:hypothetical protein